MSHRPLPIYAITLDTMIRIYEKLDRTSVPGCHIWTGSTTSSGSSDTYRWAGIRIAQKTYHVARVVYYWHYKVDPGVLQVCHNCLPNPDSPLCMNPLHLWLGTHADNMKDAYDKGNRPMIQEAKLTDADVEVIKQRSRAGERICDLATEFQVSRTLISMIINGKKRNS